MLQANNIGHYNILTDLKNKPQINIKRNLTLLRHFQLEWGGYPMTRWTGAMVGCGRELTRIFNIEKLHIKGRIEAETLKIHAERPDIPATLLHFTRSRYKPRFLTQYTDRRETVKRIERQHCIKVCEGLILFIV